MSYTAKALVNSKYAASTDQVEYTVPASARTIIDKATFTNISGADKVIDVYIVPAASAGSPTDAHRVIKAHTIAAGTTWDATELALQMLATGDQIWVGSDADSAVMFRISGREIT